MRGLIIREPWIDLILQGEKTWEMRGPRTAVRGRVALIRKGAGAVCGVADLVGTEPALDAAGLAASRDRHRIPASMDAAVLEAGWLVPWVLANARPLARPVSYVHPSGAVVWVALTPEVEAGIWSQLTTPDAATTATHGEGPKVTTPGGMSPTRSSPGPSGPGLSRESVLVILTQGNLRNGHIYLRAAKGLLPEDVLGDPNQASAAEGRLTVEFVPGRVVETDVAQDKMILRERAAVADFLARAGAVSGDRVVVERAGPRRLRISMYDGGARGQPAAADGEGPHVADPRRAAQ